MGGRKIFCAVHGMNDQTRNETIQWVAERVYAHSGKKASLPLGAFHSERGCGQAHFPVDPTTGVAGDTGFAEVYWAGLAREVETAGHTLEETKRWAETLADLKHRHDKSSREYKLLRQVIKEVIETLQVVDNLTGFLRQANILDFELKRVLDKSLGDVQLVTEFEFYRWQIVRKFHEVMDRLPPDARIFVVAHSEGSVVAFLGLLLAAIGWKPWESTRPEIGPAAPWLARVEGFMTLGSPIDKHLELWPEMWTDIATLGAELPRSEKAACSTSERIVWCNYYDYGDPVGSKLDEARRWIAANGFDSTFDFDKARDCGFGRYYTPGKAHTDYYEDDEPFRHFLETFEARRADSAAPKPPASKSLARAWSYLFPIPLIGLLLFVAVYCFVVGAFNAGYVKTVSLGDLVGYTSLVAGTTLLARIPRLVPSWFPRLAWGLGLFAVAAAGYHLCVDQKVHLPSALHDRLGGGLLMESDLVLPALAVAVASWLVAIRKPGWGMKPLVLLGTGTFLALFVSYVASLALPAAGREPGASLQAAAPQPAEVISPGALAEADAPYKWPIVLGTLAFLYLWWLAALLFDLVFIWYRYIRHAREPPPPTPSPVPLPSLSG